MIHDGSGRRGMGLWRGSGLDEAQPHRFQNGLDDLPIFDEPNDPHGSQTLRTIQKITLPPSSRGQAPIFWTNLAQLIRYSFGSSSDSIIHGMTSSLYVSVTAKVASKCWHPGARPSSIRLNEAHEPGEKGEPGV
jgi:hypothetical protein